MSGSILRENYQLDFLFIFMDLFRKLAPPKRMVRIWILEVKLLVASYIIVLIVITCLMLMNNTIRTPPEPLEYKVIEFSACKGWDNRGSAKKQQIFQPGEQVFACGRIEANRPITLSVYWGPESQQLYRDLVRDVKDQFLSEFTPTETGDYEIELVIGRDIEGSSKFVVQAQEGSNP